MGFEFNRNQKLALWTLVGLSVAAVGLSVAHTNNSVRPSAGEVVLREPGDANTPVIVSGSDPTQSGAANPYAGKVVFHIVGCVKKPGVYQLPAGERVMKAISAAGGPKENADLHAINLAAKIEDGSRIYVPSIEETKQGVSRGATYAGAAGPRAEAVGSADKLRFPGEGVVNINTAGAEELQRLPGVGPATAEKILEYRSRIGRFARRDQLMDVKGIGPKKFDKMRPFVSL